MRKILIVALICLAMTSQVQGKEINIKCRVTKYTKKECPNKYTASGKIPREGFVALSRDLLTEYKIPWEAELEIKGLFKQKTRFSVEDSTGDKIKKKDGTFFYIRRTVDFFEEHYKDRRLSGEYWVTIRWRTK